MFENRNVRRMIMICALITVFAVPFVTLIQIKVKLQKLHGSETFFQFVAEEEEATAYADETTAADEVYINQVGDAEMLDEVYINPNTGYGVFVEDDAQILDEDEERKLASQMRNITAYGNAVFKSTDSAVYDTASYAGEYYREKIGVDSGILFLIDMDNRMLWMHCDGAVYQVITKSYAETITDNVYRYASDSDYYGCAVQAFEQAFALLEGNRIAQPMKYISNALLALILALLFNYGLVCFAARIGKPRRRELLGNAGNYFHYTEPQAVFVRESRTYHPVSSGSGSRSSGSRRSGGSRSGGSRRSGGGGGHRF